MIKIVIFDFDGVIIESIDIKTNAFAKLFEPEGSEIVKKVVDYHLKNLGVSRYEKFRHIYKEILRRSLDGDEFKMLCNKFTNLVIDSVVKAPYVKGAREFLENFVTKYKYFVVSATPQQELEEIIQRRSMSHFFKATYGSPTKKSNAVKDILLKEEIKSSNAIFIGDAINDYMAAKDNNVKFIARITKMNSDNEAIFVHVRCDKIKDLTNLSDIIC